MGGKAEVKDALENESRKEDQPQTFEFKKYGYLASTKGLGSGLYDSTGLTSQASGGLEIFGMQSRDREISGGIGDDIRGLRQSSIDTEPHTLDIISVKHAKDGAVEIIETYDEDEAIHLFLKDAEDVHLREQALAAILPTAELDVPT